VISAMLARDTPELDREAVRYVSGLATVPGWLRGLDGFVPDIACAIVFGGLMVWLFWLW
jgi:hypothetical protein